MPDGVAPLNIFLSEALQTFFNSLQRPTDDEKDHLPEPEKQKQTFRPVIIEIPPGYSPNVRSIVERAGRAAGLKNISVIEVPDSFLNYTAMQIRDSEGTDLKTGHRIIPDIDLTQPYVYLHIGIEASCALLISGSQSDSRSESDVPIDDYQHSRIIAGVFNRELGANKWSTKIGEQLIENLGRSRDVTIQYNTDVKSRIAEEVRRAIISHDGIFKKDEAIPLPLDINKGIRVTAGDHVLENRLETSTEISGTIQYEALESYTANIWRTVHTLLDESGYAINDLGGILLTGDAGKLDVLLDRIKTEVSAKLPVDWAGDAVSTTAQQIHILQQGEESVQQKIASPTDFYIAIRALGGSGPETRLFGEVRYTPPASFTVPLRLPTSEEFQGQFEIIKQDTESGDIRESKAYTITGQDETNGNDGVSVNVDLRSGISEEDSGWEETISVEISSSTDAVLEQAEASTWAAFYDADPSTFPSPTVENDESATYSEAITPIEEKISTAGVENIADAVYKLRSDLWERSIKKEQSIDPSQAQTLLRKLDQRLNRYDISFFEPNIGEEANPRRHFILDDEPSLMEEGSIIEVLNPGMAIDGKIAEVAEVVVANHETPSDQDQELEQDDEDVEDVQEAEKVNTHEEQQENEK